MTEVVLDPEQVVAASPTPSGRQLVIAPPGCGKTEVVAHLLRHLVEEEELSAFDEILVISFSRAAVHALQRRAAGSPRLVGLGIRTLDSLATEILDELARDDSWLAMSFDARVEQALKLIRADGLPERLSMLRHVVVDEAQDLVGARADLVLEILRGVGQGAGFSVLGDPLQAVYNFQLSSDTDTTSEGFFDAVRACDGVVERRLTQQYRARAAEPRAAARLGGGSVTDAERIRLVRTFLAGLVAGGEVGALGRIVKRWSGSTAFLCRDNGVALEVASALRGTGLAVSVRAPAEELPIDPWVGRAVAGCSGTVRRDDLHLEDVPVGTDGAWRLLKSVERDFRLADRIDLRRLATNLARGAVPIDLRATDGNVVVSTIHRSKGLEFDNVVLVNAHELLPADAVKDELAVAFVGATRSRDEVLTARYKTDPFLRKDRSTARWVREGFKKGLTFGFEVRAIDSQPVADAPQLGGELVGAEVSSRINPRSSSLSRPVYDFEIGDVVVARTTEQFGELLVRRLRRPRKTGSPWPPLTGLVVEGLETRVVLRADGVPEMVVAPRISGLAALDWSR